MSIKLSKSPKLFMERRCPDSRTTRRLPGPRVSAEMNRARTIPLFPPFPLPELLQAGTDQSPDGHRTTVWPHGREEITQ